MDILRIDGSHMEGGGQMLRIAIGTAPLRNPKTSVNVFNIRAGRSKPGLRAQHAAGVSLISYLCNGDIKGVNLESKEVEYDPNSISPQNNNDWISTKTQNNSRKIIVDTHTAGSTSLLLQISLPVILCRQLTNVEDDLDLILRGGTNAESAPQIDYMQLVLWPILYKILSVGYNDDIIKNWLGELKLIKRGFFPRGGGEVLLKIKHLITKENLQIPPLNMMNRGRIDFIGGRVYTAGKVPESVGNRILHSTRSLLSNFDWQSNNDGFTPNINIQKIRCDSSNSIGDGCGIILYAKTSNGYRIGGSSLGKKGLKAETVGKTAAKNLLKEIETGSVVDSYLQDQLIIFMALAKGKSSILSGPLTLHTKTAIYICEKVFNIKYEYKEYDSLIEISCNGIGYKINSNMDNN